MAFGTHLLLLLCLRFGESDVPLLFVTLLPKSCISGTPIT